MFRAFSFEIFLWISLTAWRVGFFFIFLLLFLIFRVTAEKGILLSPKLVREYLLEIPGQKPPKYYITSQTYNNNVHLIVIKLINKIECNLDWFSIQHSFYTYHTGSMSHNWHRAINIQWWILIVTNNERYWILNDKKQEGKYNSNFWVRDKNLNKEWLND